MESDPHMTKDAAMLWAICHALAPSMKETPLVRLLREARAELGSCRDFIERANDEAIEANTAAANAMDLAAKRWRDVEDEPPPSDEEVEFITRDGRSCVADIPVLGSDGWTCSGAEMWLWRPVPSSEVER